MSNNCSQCGKQSYTRMCEDCLRQFDWAEYEIYFTRATYSLEDDKLRLYNVSGRLPDALYDALISLGFQRAPAQGWYGQVWTPAREDVALELCNEIEDEDVTAEERASNRQARFATYADNAARRARDAARQGAELQEYIPLGQPILVGHHSEKRARRDMERLQRLADKQVAEFDQAAYWLQRSQSALYHAHRQQRPDVVMRRVKKLETELRKYQRERQEMQASLAAWTAVKDQETAIRTANYHSLSGIFPPEQFPGSVYAGPQSFYSALQTFLSWEEARRRAMGATYRSSERLSRWIIHLEQLIGYWKSVLVEQHGRDMDAQLEIQKGHWVQMGKLWGQVVKVNRSPATKRITTVLIEPASVRGGRHWTPKWPIEHITAAQDAPPQPEITVVPPVVATAAPPPAPYATEREAARQAAAAAAAATVLVNHDDFFPTPPELVAEMVRHANPQPGNLCLEPSAGDGRIALALRERVQPTGTVWVCETNPAARLVLTQHGLNLVGADFLEYAPTSVRFNCIVMNPPFSREADVQHVQHAYTLLCPGGLLVALMSEHAFFVENRRCQTFREWLSRVGGRSERLNPDAFASVGTHVQVRLVQIYKPLVLTPASAETTAARQGSLW